jgi:hypothetical protein
MTTAHRMTDLLGMQVRFADGHDEDAAIDVRLAPSTPVRPDRARAYDRPARAHAGAVRPGLSSRRLDTLLR